MPNRLLALCALLVLLFGATGCNTIEGIGQDVKAGGQAIEKAARGAKP